MKAFCIFYFLFFFNSYILKGACKDVLIDTSKKRITIAPNLHRVEFDSIVSLYYFKTVNRLPIDTIDALNIAKLFNTVLVFPDEVNKELDTIINRFIHFYFNDIMYKLDAHGYFGGSYFSDKFNIPIGGIPEDFPESYFTVMENRK